MHGTNNHLNLYKRLLRRESSAEQAWQQVIHRFEGSPFETLALHILEDHRKSMASIRLRILQTGHQPTARADFRGNLAVHLTNAALLLGDHPLIAALCLVETDGIQEYERLLDRFDVDDPFRATISISLLPRLQNHVAALDVMVS
ncbi:MAG: hypothetical protein V4640_01130 [Verrucomicrobiota bacterium]